MSPTRWKEEANKIVPSPCEKQYTHILIKWEKILLFHVGMRVTIFEATILNKLR